MVFFEEVMDDVSTLLKSLEKAGLTMLEKPVASASLSISYHDAGQGKKTQAENPCQGCRLYPMGLPKIKGWGSGISRIVFVSSWSDERCLESGFPISGESGELLGRIIKAMNLEPENIYITNLIKCLPSPGLIVTKSDASFCMNYLQKEIFSLKPVAVILLGEFASRVFLGDKHAFESIEGRFHAWQDLRLMPTYHPDDLIKDASKKRNVWEAMKKVMTLIPSGGES